MIEKRNFCRKCGIELNDNNWSLSRMRRYDNICKKCHRLYYGRKNILNEYDEYDNRLFPNRECVKEYEDYLRRIERK